MSRRPLLLPCALVLVLAGATASCARDEEASRPLPGGSVGPSGAGGFDDGAGGGAGGGLAVGGGGPAVPACSTWEGPFGSSATDVLDPTLGWEGFSPGDIQPTTVELGDLAPCGGNDEVHAIVIYIDAVWCDVCRNVASGLGDRARDWRERGVEVVSLLVEDVDGLPADIESAWQWRSTYGLEETRVAIDPAYALANDEPDALPQALVVDPRTMRIHARTIGDVDLEPYVAQVLAGTAAE